MLHAGRVAAVRDAYKCLGSNGYGGVCASWDDKDEPPWCCIAAHTCGESHTFRAGMHFWSHVPCEASDAAVLPFNSILFSQLATTDARLSGKRATRQNRRVLHDCSNFDVTTNPLTPTSGRPTQAWQMLFDCQLLNAFSSGICQSDGECCPRGSP